VPRVARACEPDDDAPGWTCTLRGGVTVGDGAWLDAGDVLASVVAGWDGTGRLRRAASGDAFETWDALFGGPVPAGG
jgi:hypothetical protein